MNVAVFPPPLPQRLESPPARTPVAVVVLMWLAWLGVLVVADFLGFLMFAFADSPGSARSAQLMIVPVFVWFGVTFVAGLVLLIFRRWWTILLAFGLAVSPPFVVFAGYNLLDGVSRGAEVNMNATAPPSPPARSVAVPPGGFRPTVTIRQQPDFRSAFPSATTRPTTRPAVGDREDAL